MSDVADFYEDDEPVADVVAAFKRGKKGKTAAGNTVEIRPSELLDMGTSSAVAAKVSRLTVPPAQWSDARTTRGTAAA